MSQLIPWFERRFQSAYPNELLPNLMSRLRGAPIRLEEALGGVARELLIARAGNRWSALQHAGHLCDLEPLWLARMEDFIEGKEQLTPADLSNRRTDDANHNGRAAEEVSAAFRLARAALLSRLQGLGASSFERVLAHPRLKSHMRLADHLYFIAEHDDHHLARIDELTLAKING